MYVLLERTIMLLGGAVSDRGLRAGRRVEKVVLKKPVCEMRTCRASNRPSGSGREHMRASGRQISGAVCFIACSSAASLANCDLLLRSPSRNIRRAMSSYLVHRSRRGARRCDRLISHALVSCVLRCRMLGTYPPRADSTRTCTRSIVHI